ncbi:phage tail tape measure protein [Arhodomonas sp. AD133]|uniref:phage tail tape measure protein n=1 Tax=Arhodomonas sp. AD133 TaxID=3415009 RepID=UPI003EBACA88
MADRNFAVNMVIGARDRASKVVRKLNDGLGRLNNRVTQVGGAIAAYFGAQAVANFFRGAVSSAADFEQQLDRIGAVTGATGDEMDQLRAVAEEMGSTTKFTATEAAQGLEILGRAGLSAAESVETLPSVLQLAQAAGLELNEAAGIVTDSLGAMGQGVQEAGRFADVLAQGARLANTDVQSLGRALSYAGVQASQMGMSAEETVGVLDALASAGIRGERAGTALRNILSQIQDPASKARQELRKLGIDTNDLTEVIGGLEQAGPKAQKAILAFGKEAGPAVRTLLEQGREGIAEYVKSLDDAEGAAEGMAEEATDNLRGALAGLSSAWDSLRRTLVDPLMEPLKQEVRSLAETFRRVTEDGTITNLGRTLREVFQTAVEKTKAFIREIGGVQGAVDKVSGAMEKLDGALDGSREFIEFLGQFGKIVGGTFNWVAKSIVATALAAQTGIAKLEALRQKARNKLGLASDEAVAKAERAAQDFSRAWDMARKESLEALKDIGEGFGLAGEKAKGFGDKVNEGLERARATAAKWKQIADDAQSRWENMKRPVKEVNQAYLDFAASIRDAKTEAELLSTQESLRKAAEAGTISQRQLNALLDQSRERLNNLGKEAEGSGAVLRKVMDELGADVERFKSGMTTAGKEAVENFRAVAKQGDATSAQLSAAFVGALDKIRTHSAAKAMQEELAELRESGAVTQAHFERISQRLDEKLQNLGKDGADAFTREFGRITDAISGANTRAAIADLKAQLRQMFLEGRINAEQLDKGMAGLDERLDEIRQSAGETIDSMGDFETALASADTIKELDALEQSLKESWEAGRISAEQYNDALEQVREKQKQLGDEVEETTQRIRNADAASSDHMESLRGVAGALASLYAAGNRWQQKLKELRNQGGKGARNLSREYENVRDRIQEINLYLAQSASKSQWAITGVTRWVQKQERAYLQMKRKVLGAEMALQRWNERLRAGNRDVDLLNVNAEEAAKSVYLLGRQRMNQLAQSIRQAQQELRELRAQADKTLQSVQSDLLSARGEYVELAKRRIEARRSRIRDQLDAAKERDDTEAVKDLRQALKELEELEKIRVQEAKQRLEQEKKRRQEDQQRRRDEQRGGRRPDRERPTERHELQLTLPSGKQVELEGRGDQVRNLIDELERAGMRTQ